MLLPLVVFALASCKAPAKPAGHKQKATSVPIMERGRILADAKDDIAVIESVEADWTKLTPAVAGKALETLKQQIDELKKEDLVKVREYDEIKLKFGGMYEKGVAGVTAEFLDNSKIVKIDNGQPMAIARAEKRKLYLGLSKVDGTWKIISIMSGIKGEEQ